MKYTTLKGLISKTRQYSLNSFVNGRFSHINKGWVNVKLSEDLKNQIIGLFNDFLNRDITNLNDSYGIFDRLIISKSSLEVEYIAGQDYPSEIRYIRKLIK